MAAGSTPNYDAYISVSDDLEDKKWVDKELAEQLKDAGVRFRTTDDLNAPPDPETADRLTSDQWVEVTANAIRDSRFSVFVLTPEWLESGRGTFENALSQLQDSHGVAHHITLIWLRDCPIPDNLKIYIRYDLRVPEKRDREIKKLIGRLVSLRTIEQGVTVVPPPRRFAQVLGLKLRGWALEHPIRAGLLTVLFVLILSALVGFPAFEGWAPMSSQNFGAGARILSRVGDTLFILTATDKGCSDPLDTGLWRYTKQKQKWERVSIPALRFTTQKGCDLDVIQTIVQDPDDSQRLYAATANVGLLVSPDTGASWTRVQFKEPTAAGANFANPGNKLTTVAVLPSPRRLYVVGENPAQNGFYRSADGLQWDRLDVPGRCKIPDRVSLPTSATIRAFVQVQAQRLYIAPVDIALRGVPPEDADIYYSDDGGDCWRSLHHHDPAQHVAGVGYSALASIPGANSEILFATWQAGGPTRHVWRRNLENDQEEFLGDILLPPLQIFVVPDGSQWYSFSPFGLVMRGSMGTYEPPQWLPGPFSLFGSFALDFDDTSTLLLSGGRIFRRAQVGWWQSLFP